MVRQDLGISGRGLSPPLSRPAPARPRSRSRRCIRHHGHIGLAPVLPLTCMHVALDALPEGPQALCLFPPPRPTCPRRNAACQAMLEGASVRVSAGWLSGGVRAMSAEERLGLADFSVLVGCCWRRRAVTRTPTICRIPATPAGMCGHPSPKKNTLGYLPSDAQPLLVIQSGTLVAPECVVSMGPRQ